MHLKVLMNELPITQRYGIWKAHRGLQGKSLDGDFVFETCFLVFENYQVIITFIMETNDEEEWLAKVVVGKFY